MTPTGATPVEIAALEVTTTAMVAGGAAIAREASGRVVLVEGALPGERVRAEPVDVQPRLVRARLLDVLDPSPDRVAPPCPEVANGCGGCDLQHARPEAQPDLKAAVVRDALRRLGRLDDAPVRAGTSLAPTGYRTTVRCAVVDGRAGYRRRASHDVVAVDGCLVAHPLAEALRVEGRFDGADEVTFRVGARTGERLVVASPEADGVEVPDGVLVVGEEELRRGKRAWMHEVVAGHTYRISAHSFFQARPDGAEALLDAVSELGGAELAEAATVVDAYAGVGLFARALATDARRVVAVEWSRSSVADATVNLEPVNAKVVRSDVARWRPSPAEVVIADPSRAGLGPKAVRALAGTGASVLVLVSCDAAALGRDAGLLAQHGFRFDEAVVVDLFPHTHHLEVVSRFVR